jgi:hypothetical protein
VRQIIGVAVIDGVRNYRNSTSAPGVRLARLRFPEGASPIRQTSNP